MKKISKHLPLIVSIILILGFSCGAYILYGRVGKAAQDVATLSEQYQSAALAQSNAEAQANSLSNLSSAENQVNSYLVPKDGEVDFINLVEGEASGDGLKVAIGSVAEDPGNLTDNALTYLTLNISVTGSWNTVYHFLEQLESLPYDVTINQSDIVDLSDNAGGPTAWQGTFSISALKLAAPHN